MKAKRFLVSLYAVLLLLAAFPAEAFASGAGGYRFPTITVLAYHAPADLEIRVEVQKNGESVPETTQRSRRAWELSFRLYREDVFRANSFKGNDRDFAGSVLLCRSGGEERRIPIPQSCLTDGGSRDVMTLDCQSWTLSPGLPAWRGPLILGMRVLMVILVQALLFLVMGYREWRSWLCLVGVNLATQIPLNLLLNQRIWVNDTNWHSAVFMGVLLGLLLLVLAAETMVMALVVKEQDRDRTGSFVIYANAASVVALVAALIWLPV